MEEKIMEEKIIEIIEKIKGEKREDLDAKSDIIKEYRLDSLDTVNFFLNLEDEFDIIIDFENFDFSWLNSVEKLAEYIRSKINE